MKHTRGQLYVHVDQFRKEGVITICKDLSHRKHEATEEQVATVHGDMSLAYQLAAAPEMLEALLLVRKELTIAVSYGLKDEHVTFVLKEIEQALNKARGKE